MSFCKKCCLVLGKITIVCTIVLLWLLLIMTVVSYTYSKVVRSKDSKCSHQIYNGTICKRTLQGIQNCSLKGLENGVHISSDVDQSATERLASLLLRSVSVNTRSFNDTLITSNTRSTVNNNTDGDDDTKLVFVCQYLFPLCNSSGELLLPSQEHCMAINNLAFQTEWEETAELASYTGEAPRCNHLPRPTASSNCTYTEECDNISCSEDFLLINGSCRPHCGKWKPFSETTYNWYPLILSISISLLEVGGFIFIFFSCLRKNHMFSFPSTLLLISIVDYMIFGVFVLLNQWFMEPLYCSSEDFTVSLEQRTAYCKFQGVAALYLLLHAHMMRFVHVCVTFWAVYFPFNKQFVDKSGHTKYLHAACIGIPTLAALAPGIIGLATDSFGFKVYSPFGCSTELDVLFFTFSLPIVVLNVLGTTLIVVVFWRVLKLSQKGKARSSWFALSKTENKLLVISVYFAILVAILSLNTIYNNVHTDSNTFKDELESYFLCKSFGTVSASGNRTCDKTEIEKLAYPEITAIVYFLTGLYPFVSLVYFVKFDGVKKKRRLRTMFRNSNVLTITRSQVTLKKSVTPSDDTDNITSV